MIPPKDGGRPALMTQIFADLFFQITNCNRSQGDTNWGL